MSALDEFTVGSWINDIPALGLLLSRWPATLDTLVMECEVYQLVLLKLRVLPIRHLRLAPPLGKIDLKVVKSVLGSTLKDSKGTKAFASLDTLVLEVAVEEIEKLENVHHEVYAALERCCLERGIDCRVAKACTFILLSAKSNKLLELLHPYSTRESAEPNRLLQTQCYYRVLCWDT